MLIIVISSRLGRIMNEGTNTDGSAATRWFKINSSLHGYVNSGVLSTFVGWGMGNMIMPVKMGANNALKVFSSSYTSEVEDLQRASEVDFLACLPIKLVSEWGLAFTLIVFISILLKCRKRKIDIYVFLLICWLYVQFDSYCFYSFWLLLYLANYYDPERHGISFFDIIS